MRSKKQERGWKPESFVRQIAALRQEEFAERSGSEHFLLVNLSDADEPFVRALAYLFEPPDDDEEPITLERDGSPAFRTATDFHDAEASILVNLVDEPHFIVPVRRFREALVEHGPISVGRTSDTDIVLRHRSVSKLHAWFEYEPTGGLIVRDARSKNGTWVNGQRLTEGDQQLENGDALSFGSVECAICNARTLWKLVEST